MNLRLALLPVHRWVGMTLGLIVLVSAVTGAGMAFRNSLDPLVYPKQFHAGACAAPLPMDAFVAAARRLHPAGAVDYLRIRGEADAPVAVRFTNKDTLYLDRCTAQLSASQNRYEGVFGQLEQIHRMVFFPNGGWLMGAGAICMLVLMGGVGLYLWWPRTPRRFLQGFVLDRRLKGRGFTLGLHRTVGGWAALMLMVSAATALPNAFDGVKAAIMGWGAPAHEARPRSHGAKGTPRLPMQAAYATATRLSPAPREMLMHLARRPADPIEIYIIDAHAPHANARTYLYLDAYSGRVLRFAPYAASGWGSLLYYWMLSVHTGEVGGIFGQLLLFAGAASVPVLAYSGLSSYLQRRFARRPVRRTAEPRVVARS